MKAFFIFIAFLVFSCENQVNKCNLKVLSEKEHYIQNNLDPNVINYLKKGEQFLKDQLPTIANFCPNINTVIYLSIQDDSLIIKHIKTNLSKDMAEDKANLNFGYINEKKFYLFNPKDQVIAIYNDKGNEVHRYSTTIKDQNNTIKTLLYDEKAFIKNDKIILPTIYNGIPATSAKLKDYYNRNFGLIINKDSTYSIPEIKFPYNYRKGKGYHDISMYLSTNKENDLYASFSKNDSLFIYNKDGQFKSKHFFGINFTHHFNYFENKASLKQLKTYLKEEPRYFQLRYDPYNKMLIRSYKKRTVHNKNSIKKTKPETVWIFMDTQKHIYYDPNVKKLHSISLRNIGFSPKGMWDIEFNIKNGKHKLVYKLFQLDYL
ncbi:MAG: hypothetical protein ACEPOV_00355 [Hyphomicrobiales bacterium]